MATFEVSAHMTVRPGQLEGFKKQAAECIRITKEEDTHTLRYDWFLSLDGTECEVREAYTGPEGLIEHNRNIVDARTKLFKDYADDHFMTFYGDVSEPLLNLLKTHSVGHKWFSFLQGLEPSAVIPQPILVSARETVFAGSTADAAGRVVRRRDEREDARTVHATASRDAALGQGRRDDLCGGASGRSEHSRRTEGAVKR